jgi:hypothetical protein
VRCWRASKITSSNAAKTRKIVCQCECEFFATFRVSPGLNRSVSGHFFVGGAFEEFVEVRLVGLGLFGGEAAESREDARSDADGDQMFGVAGHRAAHAAGAAELLVSGFRNIGKVQLAIRYLRGVLCALPDAR